MFLDFPWITPLLPVRIQTKMPGTEKLVPGILISDRYGTRKWKTHGPASRVCSPGRARSDPTNSVTVRVHSPRRS